MSFAYELIDIGQGEKNGLRANFRIRDEKEASDKPGNGPGDVKAEHSRGRSLQANGRARWLELLRFCPNDPAAAKLLTPRNED
jgi:hypothetical protein